MTENIFERLARKIEQAKARCEREAMEGLKPGFGRNAAGGLTYEAKVEEEPVKAPAEPPAPSTPLQQKLGEPAGVWRKTSEHKPPVGSEHLTRYTGRGCEKAPDVRPLVWNGEVWLQGAAKIGSCALRDWLDTSGEFKVGDRVRVKERVVSRFCKPGMFGVVTDSTVNVWFLADGENHPFCATGWLEHAPDAPQSN